MLRKSNLWRGLAMVFGLLLAVFAIVTHLANYYAGFVNDRLGITPPTITTGGNTMYYPSAYGDLNAENCATLIKDENDFNVRAMQEGAVMLRNENGALPLKDAERRITLFGNSVKSPVYATNGGGSSFKSSRGGALYDAFKSAGFAINDTLFNAYKASEYDRVSSSDPGVSDIGEAPLSFYTDALKASYASDYNDVAVVLLTRYGGEGVDLDHVKDKDGEPLLSFHKKEADLLKMIKDSGKFKKTVVLINSPFAMDTEWIEDEQYGVDACLAFGAAGDVGFIGIANILTGKSDVTGHLTDTYATSSLSAPAMRNFGNFEFSDYNAAYQNTYVVYAEDIYVGYKYYETRYNDQVLGINNASGKAGVYASKDGWNYAEEMAYPFGYGLSYADFKQEVKSIVWDKTAHTVKAEVEVTNTGSKVGYTGKSKCAVQFYASAPYEKGQVEKSAIQLIGFAKSKELGVGENDVLKIEASDYLFASYDKNATNGADADKKGCYIFDKGKYYFAIGNDCHDALNNVLAAKEVTGTLTDEKGNTVTGDKTKAVEAELEAYDNTTYAKSAATDYTVSNHYDEIDYNHFVEGGITYLTRADWNTYPKAYTALATTEQMRTLLVGKTYVKDPSITSDSVTVSAKNNIEFVEMKDVPYGDAKWDEFVNQLSISDLATIMGETMGNAKISTVNKPANANTDGPKGLGSTYKNGDKSGITLYVDQVVMASTFNLDLHAERGKLFAEDALYAGYSMIFGPGADMHRTAYSGRNSEYYSEDGAMSYYCGAAQVAAMQKGGLIAAIKHFVGNDQETNRHGVATFATEQAFRLGSLRCFEGALRDDVGGGLGTMTCFNRIGLTAGAASYATLVEVLRNEWGFKGVNLTDSSKDASDYVHTEECVMGGTDMFNNDETRTNDLTSIARRGNDGKILKQMQQVNKHYYYAYSRSNLVNGLQKGVAAPDFIPWWKPVLITIDVLFGLAALALAVLFVLGTYVFKKDGENKTRTEKEGE